MVPPAVSLSVGVAFADRENPGESIFKDADKTLYRVSKKMVEMAVIFIDFWQKESFRDQIREDFFWYKI